VAVYPPLARRVVRPHSATIKYGELMSIFNKGGENVLHASVADTGGRLAETRDQLGYRRGVALGGFIAVDLN